MKSKKKVSKHPKGAFRTERLQKLGYSVLVDIYWWITYFELSHSAQKCEKGGSLGFLNIQISLTVPKKNRKGDPLVSSDFVCYVKKE